MAHDPFHEKVLDYGITDGVNLPGQPEGQYYCVGRNATHGCV